MSPDAPLGDDGLGGELEGFRRDTKRSDGFLEAPTEGLAFHDVLGDVAGSVHLSKHPSEAWSSTWNGPGKLAR